MMRGDCDAISPPQTPTVGTSEEETNNENTTNAIRNEYSAEEKPNSHNQTANSYPPSPAAAVSDEASSATEPSNNLSNDADFLDPDDCYADMEWNEDEAWTNQPAREAMLGQDSAQEDPLALPAEDCYNDSTVDSNPEFNASINKPNKPSSSLDDDINDIHYILGTLVVRVVAARDLPSVGGFGSFLLNPTASRHGTANPYASVRFGGTTQRTSRVYDSTNPIWPRGESMFMDVVVQRNSTNRRRRAAGMSADQSELQEGPLIATVGTDTKRKKAAGEEDEDDLMKPTKAGSQVVAGNTAPIVTVAVFHAQSNLYDDSSDPSVVHKYNAGSTSGDSDDRFLGMCALNVNTLLTGKDALIDEWFPLTGGPPSAPSTIRIVCEYEPSEARPGVGQLVRFTEFCAESDVYPLPIDGIYQVTSTSLRNADMVMISTTEPSPEGWISSFTVHRHQVRLTGSDGSRRLIGGTGPTSVWDVCQDELLHVSQRLQHSPLVHVVQESVSRLPDEGLLGLGSEALSGGAFVLQGWLQGGPSKAVDDVIGATNWDGRFNPTATELLTSPSHSPPQDLMTKCSDDSSADLLPTLPNMPTCPITGDVMRDPVVAADGHTYERAAIRRWLETSDTSPLTGAVLPHKELVPNYMLLTSLQEALEQQQQQGLAHLKTEDSSDGSSAAKDGEAEPPSDSAETMEQPLEDVHIEEEACSGQVVVVVEDVEENEG